MLSILSCVCWQSVYLLWRNVYLGLLPIFWLCCLFFWYWAAWAVLEINPLSVDSFANIFSHSEGCLFVLFIVSFAVQKLWSLIRSHLFISETTTHGHPYSLATIRMVWTPKRETGEGRPAMRLCLCGVLWVLSEITNVKMLKTMPSPW